MTQTHDLRIMSPLSAVPGWVGFPGVTPDFGQCVLYAAGSVVSLDLGHVPGVLTNWGDVVRLVLRIGGPILLGLAALAVRGRVKR